jgi:hypothetical protein
MFDWFNKDEILFITNLKTKNELCINVLFIGECIIKSVKTLKSLQRNSDYTNH